MYSLIFYVPDSHLEIVKRSIFAVGGGLYDGYDQCCWQVAGQGQFRPLPGSKPFIGESLTVTSVEEYKVELVCSAEHIVAAVEALIANHPYEQPAYQVTPFLNLDALRDLLLRPRSSQ